MDILGFAVYATIGTLFAIIYLLRIMFLMEKRIARMDENLFRITTKILKEEMVIEAKLNSRMIKKPIPSKKKKTKLSGKKRK